jgi:hypothetical protein
MVVAGKAVLVLDMGCRLADMDFHPEAAVEVGASIAAAAADHMRQARATDIQYSVVVVAAEGSRLVATQRAPVQERDLVHQPLGVTQEAYRVQRV